MLTTDVIVIGGGLVGSAIAYGMARQGTSVTVLDEGDVAFRASRGNFGLVWVQGKGYGCADYARWSRGSSRMWPGFRDMLREETGIDVELSQRGGYHICLDQGELEARRERLQWLQDAVGADEYPFEMMDANAARVDLPGLNPDVAGVSYTPMDGHCNPLKLLHALHTINRLRGVDYRPSTPAQTISHQAGVFTVSTPKGSMQAPRLIIAAGLATPGLSAQVGMYIPVRPNKGQVLITERVAPMLHNATNYVRQTDEGTVQIGDSMEDLGYDDSVHIGVSAEIAARAIRCFPSLRHTSLVRTWSALRIMTPDGFPIYQESASCPGAFAISCHSGVTLAAQHSLAVAPWMLGGEMPNYLSSFSANRFTPDMKFAEYDR